MGCLSPRKTPLTPPILWKHPSFSPKNQAQIYRKAVRRLACRIHLLVDYQQKLNRARFYRQFPNKETCGMPLRRIRFLCADARVSAPKLTTRMTQARSSHIPSPRDTRREHGATVNYELTHYITASQW